MASTLIFRVHLNTQVLYLASQSGLTRYETVWPDTILPSAYLVYVTAVK